MRECQLRKTDQTVQMIVTSLFACLSDLLGSPNFIKIPGPRELEANQICPMDGLDTHRNVALLQRIYAISILLSPCVPKIKENRVIYGLQSSYGFILPNLNPV